MTRPRQPTSASRWARRGTSGGPSGRPRDPGDAGRAVAHDRRREAQAVGGDPGEQTPFAGRLDAVPAEPLQDVGAGPDPDEAGVAHGGREPRVARQRRRHGEDGRDPAAGGGLDDAVHREVGLAGRGGPEQHGVVGHADVPGRPLGLGVDGHRLDPEPGQGRDHRARRRATTGHQHALDPQLCHGRSSCVPPTGPHAVREPDRPVRGLPGQLGGPGDAAHDTCALSPARDTRVSAGPPAPREEGSDVQAWTQAALPQEERRQPRQAAQRLTCSAVTRAPRIRSGGGGALFCVGDQFGRHPLHADLGAVLLEGDGGQLQLDALPQPRRRRVPAAPAADQRLELGLDPELPQARGAVLEVLGDDGAPGVVRSRGPGTRRRGTGRRRTS